MGIQELVTELKKLAVTPRYKPQSRDIFCEISRNVWEIPGFGGSENLLLNNRTHLHFVHISQFLAKSWHFGIQTELVFWIFDIFWFWSIFGVILTKIWQKLGKFAFFGSKLPQKWPKIKEYQKSKKTSSLCIIKCQFSAKNGDNMDKM